MVGTLTRRVERLEQSYGSGAGSDDCPRCAGTVVIIDTFGDITVSRRSGANLTGEAAKAFYLEEQPNDICPRCETPRRKVVVGWGSESLRRVP